MEASPVGSRTLDEDVHLGLEAATLMRWRPDAKQVLVLIGDAEAHPENVNETFWRVRRTSSRATSCAASRRCS